MARGRLANIQRDGRPVAGAEPGNDRAATHHAHREVVVKKVATVQKRRLLRQIGLRQSDLDAIALGYLDNWARAQSKVELLDTDYERRGFIDRRGKPRPSTQIYFTALNCASRNLDKLAAHLKAQGQGERSMVLELATRERS